MWWNTKDQKGHELFLTFPQVLPTSNIQIYTQRRIAEELRRAESGDSVNKLPVDWSVLPTKILFTEFCFSKYCCPKYYYYYHWQLTAMSAHVSWDNNCSAYLASESLKEVETTILFKLFFRAIQDILPNLCISPKKAYRWVTNTRKDAQHHSLLEKCKNQNYNEIPSHSNQNGHHKKIYKQ